MEAVLARALLLYEQGRYELAEREARGLLAQQPDHAHAHAVLAMCLVKREDYKAALHEAAEAVRLEPTFAYTHYVRGHVLMASNRLDEALAEAGAAVHLDPTAPHHYALVAAIHLNRRRWREALEAAENGLSLDPEDVNCNNVRGMALVKLGRRAEAGATMAQTLARDPEDAFTHANRGWSLLHDRKPREAMEHFREALRLDPTMDWARAGIVEALKAHNFVYRWMLAYFLWMSRLSARAQWGIIVGGWFGMQVVRNVGERNPALKPYAVALFAAYAVFAVMTWLAEPLFNLLLRLNRYGRMALSDEQKTASNWVGGMLLATVALFVAFLVKGWFILGEATILCGVTMIPLSSVFRVSKGWPRALMGAATIVLALVTVFYLWQLVAADGVVNPPRPSAMLNGLMDAVLACLIGSIILANGLAFARVKKG
jgi:tetratricopeptide (TPR) repeat protein